MHTMPAVHVLRERTRHELRKHAVFLLFCMLRLDALRLFLCVADAHATAAIADAVAAAFIIAVNHWQGWRSCNVPRGQL